MAKSLGGGEWKESVSQVSEVDLIVLSINVPVLYPTHTLFMDISLCPNHILTIIQPLCTMNP